MKNRKILMNIIESIGDKYTFFVENYSEETDLCNRIVFIISDDNLMELIFDDEKGIITSIVEFAPEDDILLEKHVVDDLLDEFKKEESPFEMLVMSDEHTGLDLVKLYNVDEFDAKYLIELIEYIKKPNEFVKKLMTIKQYEEEDYVR